MVSFAEVFGSEGMGNKVTLYVPSTVTVDQPLSQSAADEFVSRSLRLLSELFGGATAITAKGAWVANDGELVVEVVTLVYSFSANLTTDDLVKIKAFAETLKAELGQEAIAVEVNDRLLLI